LTQPDVCFIASDRLFIVDKYIDGAPDLVVEVLSKGTTKIDRNDKMKAYRKFGVSEYWIVDYQKRTVEVYALINDDYEMVFLAEETGFIQSLILEGLKMDLDDIFD
jgi:Uma2 family endonuclease